MLKLIIGNKAYSSWSLRGWLAVKQSGLPFEEITVPMFDEDWDKRREGDEFAPSGGKVPILWDDKAVIWDSLARARHGGGGPYLFGDFGAVDIMFAPVVTRFVTYSVPVPRFAMTYMEAILDHPWMKQWIDAAQEEPWVIERYETPVS